VRDNQSAERLDIRVAGNIHLTAEVETVLRKMFSAFRQIAVEAEFGRGFSGSRTFRVRLVEPGGRAYLPTAIKIAPAGLIQREWEAYQTWVEHTIPNIAQLKDAPVFPAGSQWGGLHYSLVGDGTFPVQSLRDYSQEATLEDLCWVLENRLFEIIGSNWWLDSHTNRAFQMQSDYDLVLPVNLLLKFSESVSAGTAVIEAGDRLPAFAGAAGDAVQLKGFVVVKADQKRQELTLNFPPIPEGHAPLSYRVRVTDVPNMAAYQTGQVIEVITGVVTATRHDQLVGQVKQALGEAVDTSAARVVLPTGLDVGISYAASSGLKQNYRSAEVKGAFPASLPNPLLSYQNLLRDFLPVKNSTIHGDLNLENILVDPATREVSLIDFATVRQGHVLHDLLRLETEVLVTLIPPILAEDGWPAETIVPFYEHLNRVTWPSNEAAAPELSYPALNKPLAMLRVIRKMARKCLFNLDDWREYSRGLILYLLGALKFKPLDDLPTAPLPKQVAFWGAASAQQWLENSAPQPRPRPAQNRPSAGARSRKSAFEIEPPFGTMRPDSPFYIEREADEQCWRQLNSSYATTLFAQAPMQTGKSSLLRRLLYQVKQSGEQQVAYIDFQKFTEQYLADEENFFIQLCLMIGDALGLPEAIDQYWSGRRTHIIKCSHYLSDYIIPRLKGPFILAMDEVERMQACPFRGNFFGMLRTWHNDRVANEHFAQMTLFLSSSTDPYLLIDNPNQSPFNVATPVNLQDFTLDEVAELNRRHYSPVNQTELEQLIDLVGGHPFLTRVALYLLARGKVNLPALLTHATEDNGPFGEHLRHYLRRILRKPELKQALTLIVHQRSLEENDIFHRLREAGLIKRAGPQVVFRNKLYEQYFKERLNG
jgi:hypothetical protein